MYIKIRTHGIVSAVPLPPLAAQLRYNTQTSSLMHTRSYAFLETNINNNVSIELVGDKIQNDF